MLASDLFWNFFFAIVNLFWCVTQVLAIFRSFPFRAPAAPIDDGAGSLVEETQAPQPPSYSTIMREPEEAGEVTPAQPDPENVGEDAATTQSAVKASL